MADDKTVDLNPYHDKKRARLQRARGGVLFVGRRKELERRLTSSEHQRPMHNYFEKYQRISTVMYASRSPTVKRFD